MNDSSQRVHVVDVVLGFNRSVHVCTRYFSSVCVLVFHLLGSASRIILIEVSFSLYMYHFAASQTDVCKVY